MSAQPRLPRAAEIVQVAAAVLVGTGLVMSYSATAPLQLESAVPPHFVREAIAVAAGIALAALAGRVPPRWWLRSSPVLWGIGVVLLALTAIVGVESHGARRWLALPGLGLRLQPGELARVFALLALAGWTAGRAPRDLGSLRALGLGLLLAGVPAGLLLLEPDTGGAALLVLLAALLLFVAGAAPRVLATLAGVAASVLGASLWLHPYAARRLVAFRDPWAHASDAGFQLVQSFVAFARGGLFGVGVGDGRAKLFYLPEAHTDFVLSVVGEELGLVGVLFVLAAFAALGAAGFRIARTSGERSSFLLATAMTAALVVPAVLNAAVVMGLVPPKGLVLPFVSYGRTALLAAFLELGILLGVARHAPARARPPRGLARGIRRWRG